MKTRRIRFGLPTLLAASALALGCSHDSSMKRVDAATTRAEDAARRAEAAATRTEGAASRAEAAAGRAEQAFLHAGPRHETSGTYR